MSRQKGLEATISQIYELWDIYLGESQISSYNGNQCDMIVLGGFIKALRSWRLLPRPEAPYNGLSINGLGEDMIITPIKTACDHINRTKCGVHNRFMIYVVETLVIGLRLDDFIKL